MYRQVAPHDEHGAGGGERGAREQREGAPEEKPGVGEQQRDALNKNVGASTDIRIAPPKTFAALSEKHDASTCNIGAPNKKMIASSSGLQWSDDRLHGAAERVGASAKS